MKLIYEGVLSAGYYNDMENGHPVFIDGLSLSDIIIKNALNEEGLDINFCYGPFEDDSHMNNPLVGKKVKLTLEIIE